MTLDFILTFIFVFLPTLFALICLYYSLQFLKAARNIEDTPTSKIRSAAQGYVELSGISKKINNQPIYAKLTQKPCAWYYYKVENLTAYYTDGEKKSIWNITDQGVCSDPFLLDDSTGECAILPAGAEVIPSTKIIWRGYSRIPTPPPTSLLGWLLWGSWGTYRYTETRIELGAPTYVSGMFYTFEKNHPLMQSNPSLSCYFNEKTSPTLNLLTKEGLSSGKNFLISTVPQAHLVRKFKLKFLVFLLSFFFFAILPLQSTYPIVKNTLLQWQNKNNFKIPIFHPR